MSDTDAPQSSEQPSFGVTGWWVIVATVSASGMAFFMQSALNVALPAIQTAFSASGADQVWIVNSYQLLLSALLLLGGSLGDLYGRKRIYIIGIVIFTLGCVISGFAPSVPILIASRALMGIGGALMIPGSLALISSYFDDSLRGRAIGTWASFTTGASLLAPLAGGALADLGLWRAIFFLCVPLALLALYALLMHVPESRDEDAAPTIDVTGAVLIFVALVGIVYGTTEIGRGGSLDFSDPVPFIAIMVGVIAFAAFIVVERRSDAPLIPLRLFRSRTFSGVNLLTFLLYGSLGVVFFFVPLNLQQIQGYTAVFAGFAGLPISLAIMGMSGWAGGLVDRIGPRPPLIGGPILVGIGYLLLMVPGVTAGMGSYWWTYFPGFTVIGIGMGVVVAPVTTAALGSVPQHNAGVASGINNLMSRASGAVATATLGGIALLLFSGLLQTNITPLDLSAADENIMMENARELAGATPPASINDEATVTALDNAIDIAFVNTFRAMMLVGAVMSFASALLAYWLVEPVLSHHDELDEPAPQP